LLTDSALSVRPRVQFKVLQRDPETEKIESLDVTVKHVVPADSKNLKNVVHQLRRATQRSTHKVM
jgi:hypothetical protein